MREITGGFTKHFYFVFFLFCVDFPKGKLHSTQIDLGFLNFEQIKNDLFLQLSDHLPSSNSEQNWACLNDINNIKHGLEKSADWSRERKFMFYNGRGAYYNFNCV